ncbi:WxL domain-containing protein [Lapidilactobacillus wuchangensis]|uniref:WxL domain-containing protein n=1 Tax=Lapidilactobacillus wuchangensis TaxID=2486001 RepID=UPI000F7B2800|nr:WxL domain-containing protein [Lapidilactobacillus wuchangensis]
MKMTKTFTLLATLALGLSVAAGTSSVKAAEVSNNKGETTAQAELTTTDPTDPGTGDSVIKLMNVPDINFGSKQLTGEAIKFTQADETATSLVPIKVLNQGIASGWNLTVQRTNFTTAAPDSVLLKGAVLKFGKGSIDLNSDGLKATDGKDYAADNLLTVDTAAKTVLLAEKDGEEYQGVGENTKTLAATDFTLDVPANNTAGTYSADLTWTLANTVQ